MFISHIYTRLLGLVFAKALCLSVAICADKDIELIEAKTALGAAIEILTGQLRKNREVQA
jgi:hypothetical protein